MTESIILSSLMKVILGNLSSLAVQEFGLARNLKTELEKLKITLLSIQDVIQDAEEKQIKSEPVKNWLRKLKDAAYDADDVLDEYATEVLRRRAESHDFKKNKVRNFFSPHNTFKFRFNMGHKIEAIAERLNGIAGEKSNFNLIKRVTEDKMHDDGERPPTSSFVTESEIYGRDDDKEKIVELLLTEGSSQEDVSIYAIVGMGGLGKTTLAQLVYNHKRVEMHFELRIWVCVSQDFEITRLTKAIIESASGNTCDVTELDPMQRHLTEKLSGRRFILVLDDVWNEVEEEWDRLKHVLRCGAKGSTIIVTTRSQKVASIMATLHPKHLRVLSEDDCWSLFKERAFGSGKREESPNLVAIGKEIVKKCGGVPLAVKALGSLMRFKSEESEWLSVKESEIWDLSDVESAILSALRLSYNHLPSHMKQCFSYCSIFPKNHKLVKDELIQLWMANGFVPLKGQKELEDMGHEIFNILVWGSFFQDVKQDDYGNTTFKMHDLVHDLAHSIMENECIIIDRSKVKHISERIRHLSCTLQSLLCNSNGEGLFEAKSLRTFILYEKRIWDRFIISQVLQYVPSISKQRCLRVLCFYCDQKIPISVDNLKHLRYLDLSASNFDQLPESISRLYNLQTLKLRYCTRLCKLPNDMRHMINLRYLDIVGCDSLTCMPTRMGELTCLRTLTRFIVGKDNGHCIGELQFLKLKGELSIENLGEVKDLEEAKDANLIRKHIQSLSLSWRNNENVGSQTNGEEVLEGLKPHTNLKKMCITGYHGSKFAHWMCDLSLLRDLVEISLLNCKSEDLPPLGKLSSLKVLRMDGMDGVKYLDSELEGDDTVKAFPSLEKLTIGSMPNLEKWTRVKGREIFSCLRELDISACPKLNFTSLSTLEIDDFPEQMSLPDGFLRNHTLLQYLRICRLPHLKSLSSELDNLIFLRKLILEDCAELAYLPEGLRKLTSLNSLVISSCDSLMSLPEKGLQGLSSLQVLKISNCKKLVSLSEGVRHLTLLKYLYIENCLELTSLPEGMENLTSLSELKIWYCNNLMSLPEGLQCLTTLETMEIGGCPHLERRCRKESGEDWHKIAHIRHFRINAQVICLESTPPIC